MPQRIDDLNPDNSRPDGGQKIGLTSVRYGFPRLPGSCSLCARIYVIAPAMRNRERRVRASDYMAHPTTSATTEIVAQTCDAVDANVP